jgi:hypothetical protein
VLSGNGESGIRIRRSRPGDRRLTSSRYTGPCSPEPGSAVPGSQGARPRQLPPGHHAISGSNSSVLLVHDHEPLLGEQRAVGRLEPIDVTLHRSRPGRSDDELDPVRFAMGRGAPQNAVRTVGCKNGVRSPEWLSGASRV